MTFILKNVLLAANFSFFMGSTPPQRPPDTSGSPIEPVDDRRADVVVQPVSAPGTFSALDEVVDDARERLDSAALERELLEWGDLLVARIAELDLATLDPERSRIIFQTAGYLRSLVATIFDEGADDVLNELYCEHHSEALITLANDLDDFLLLNFGYTSAQRQGEAFLRYALESSDKLAGRLNTGASVDSRSVVSDVAFVRNSPSYLLSRAMMQRVNGKVADPERRFLHGRELATQVGAEIDQFLLNPDGQDPALHVLWDVLKTASAAKALRDLGPENAHFLTDRDDARFCEYVIASFERNGPLRPSFLRDFRALMAKAFERMASQAILRQSSFPDRWHAVQAMDRNVELELELAGKNHKELHSDKADLPNERAFEQALKELFEEYPPRPGAEQQRFRPYRVVFLDLNGFKSVNDHAAPIKMQDPLTGHSHTYHKYALGDHVIYRAGEAMKSVLRADQKLFHLHGDEFAMILPPDISEAALVRIFVEMQRALGQLSDALNMVHQTERTPIRVGIAAGVNAYNPNRFPDTQKLVEHVAALMGQAKKQVLPTGETSYRSFEEKCSVVLGTGFERPGRYDRNGHFIEELAV